MKKVVLISDGWKRLITYAWVVGIMEAIQESLESFGIPLNDEMIWYGMEILITPLASDIWNK